MRKRIFIRIFLAFLICVLTVFGIAAVAVRYGSANRLRNRLETEMRLLMRVQDLAENPDELANLCDADLWIRLEKEDGTVLFDSLKGDDGTGEADAEFRAALENGTAERDYYSDRFGCRVSTYAVRFSSLDEGICVLRLALRNDVSDTFFCIAVPCLFATLLLVLAVANGLSRKVVKRFSDRLRAIADSLCAPKDGVFCPIDCEGDDAEYRSAIREINELNEKTYAAFAAQRTERVKLATVLDIVSQGIVALDPAFRILLANKSARQQFGHNGKIGQSLFEFVCDDELCRRIREYEEGGSFEYRYGERQLIVVVRPIADRALSKEIAQIVIVTDVTDARDIAKEKSDFFANASHELKTPLTVTLGLSELILARDGLDGSVRSQAERIHREALRMSELISDMLRLSRLEQHGEVKRETVDLRAIADEVLSELAPRIQEKALRVGICGQGTVLAAPERMYELLINLCSNAVNYNVDGGELAVSISVEDGHTVLCVRDSGIGIPQEHLSRICERFYRVDRSRSKKTGGTGLGLAIVKHICVLYGAELKFESVVGKGTDVTVRF